MEIEKLDYCGRGIYFKKDKCKTQAFFIHFELEAFLKSSNLFCMLCAPPWTLYSALIYSLHKFLLTRVILDFMSIHINQHQTCWDWKHLRKQLCFYARESRNKITWFYFLQKILQVGLFNWRFNISLHRNINKNLVLFVGFSIEFFGGCTRSAVSACNIILVSAVQLLRCDEPAHNLPPACCAATTCTSAFDDALKLSSRLGQDKLQERLLHFSAEWQTGILTEAAEL